MHDIKHELKKFLSEEELMGISTCLGNKPWSSTVFFTTDNFLDLYFVSRTNSRHSKEIEKNMFISGTIYSKSKDFGQVKGLQFEGKVAKTDELEIEKVFHLFKNKFENFGAIYPSV